MLKKNQSARRYIVSTGFITALFFTPMMVGNAFAHGGPDAEASQNKAAVNEHVDKEETTKVVVSMGDRGEAVKQVQTMLNDHGFKLNTDGIFGAKTDGAVRDFQEDKSLAVDGIAGPKTMEALALHAAVEDENLTIKEVNEEASTSSQSEIVSIAKSLIGSPYKFGGTTPEGFDSSGFINYVFAEVGIPLNRTHADMWAEDGTHVESPTVGDVVFFEDTYQGGVSHSGIYLGNNQMIHAGTEDTGVEITTMDYDYWQDRYRGAKSFN